MADNYLEKKFEELSSRPSKIERARHRAWKKRMEAYRRKLSLAGDNHEYNGSHGENDANNNIESNLFGKGERTD